MLFWLQRAHTADSARQPRGSGTVHMRCTSPQGEVQWRQAAELAAALMAVGETALSEDSVQYGIARHASRQRGASAPSAVTASATMGQLSLVQRTAGCPSKQTSMRSARGREGEGASNA